MTIPQFLAVQRAELTYKEIRQAQREINKSYRLKRYLVVFFFGIDKSPFTSIMSPK